MALTLESSTPSAGQTDVYLNKKIELNFNQAIVASSLTDAAIFIIDVESGRKVPIVLSLNPQNGSQVLINTRQILKENTVYSLSLVGTDMGLGSYLQGETDNLTTTTSITFTTGENIYDVDVTIEKEAGNKTLEGDLFLPSNVEALGYDFTLDYILPKNRSYNVATTLNGSNSIDFVFTAPLATGYDISQWADVEVSPILDYTGYYASGETIGAVEVPSYYIYQNDKTLSIIFSGELPKNALVKVDLSNDIVSTNNDYYGGDLGYIITTQLYPDISGPNSIRRELNNFEAEIYDDYIGCLLLKNSIFLWEMTGRALNFSAPNFSIIKYVLYATVIDIIEDKDLENFIRAGHRKRIADIDVSFGNLIGRLALKLSRAEKEKDKSLETLRKGHQIKTGVLSVYLDTISQTNRLWHNVSNTYVSPHLKYYQPNEPISNISINRQAKTNNPGWI